MKKSRAQGALEYLLLIGGGVLVATVILIIALQTAPQGSLTLNTGINTYLNQINLNAGSGGGGGNCGNGTIDAGEQCDGANLNSQTCVGLGFTGGTLSCNANCTFNTTSCAGDTSPPASISLSVTPGSGSVDLLYSASDASNPITFRIAYDTSAAGTITSGLNFSSPPGSVTIFTPTGNPHHLSGLTNGTAYRFILQACDAATPTPNCGVSAVQTATPVLPSIVISLSGNIQTVFDYSTQACSSSPNDWDFPDVYAHVTRNPQNSNELVMVSGNSPHNYFLFGPDFDNLARSCTPVLTATNRKDPDPTAASSFNNQEWVNMAYNDGTQIWGIVNNEFHDISASGQSSGCSNSEYPGNPCWYNGITLARSNTGHNFVQTNTAADVMIAPPLTWDAPSMINHPYGTFEPSNIIQDGGYYYMLYRGMFTTGSNNTGTCVARTTNLSDATSWRAWDGTGFNLSVRSPYVVAGQQPCTFVGYNIWGSVTRNTYLESFGFGKYLAVGTLNIPTCGIYFSLSDDFITWTNPQLIKSISSPSCNGSFTNSYAYVSLIDHASSDQTNFTTSGQSPYIYSTRFNGVLDRDLVREQITFNVV